MDKSAAQKRKSAIAEYANAHPILTLLIGLSCIGAIGLVASTIQYNKGLIKNDDVI